MSKLRLIKQEDIYDIPAIVSTHLSDSGDYTVFLNGHYVLTITSTGYIRFNSEIVPNGVVCGIDLQKVK